MDMQDIKKVKESESESSAPVHITLFSWLTCSSDPLNNSWMKISQMGLIITS